MKMATELGWKPAETFETGIRETVPRHLECRRIDD